MFLLSFAFITLQVWATSVQPVVFKSSVDDGYGTILAFPEKLTTLAKQRRVNATALSL